MVFSRFAEVIGPMVLPQAASRAHNKRLKWHLYVIAMDFKNDKMAVTGMTLVVER